MKNTYESDYWHRIYHLQDYIESHPTEHFTAEELVKESGFSKYHFHRIFKAMTHESLYQFITRTKMEWAQGLLKHRQDLSITAISFELGFSDSAVFSRSFKTYYGISPKEFRDGQSTEYLEVQKKKRRIVPQKSNINVECEIKKIDRLKVLYQRKIGAYHELDGYEKILGDIFNYAMTHQMLDTKQSKPLAIYHSNPEIGLEENQRTSIGMIVKEDITENGVSDFGILTIDSGLFAIFTFKIKQNQYREAWDYVYGYWLPKSGFVPRNNFPFEVYLNNPMEDSRNEHHVAIYVPVEKMN